MARIGNLTNFLTDVAAAIKTKKGDNTTILAADFDTEILNLPSQGEYQQKNIIISSNGTQTITPDTGYDAIDQLVITTDVPVMQLQTKSYTFTQNATVQLLPDTGYDGFEQVNLEIDVEGEPMDPTTAIESDVISPKTFYSNGQKLTGAIIPTYGTPVPKPLSDTIVYNSSYSIWHISYSRKLVILNINNTTFAIAKIINGSIDYTNMVTYTVSELTSTTYTIINCKFADTDLDNTVLWVFGSSGGGPNYHYITRCELNTSNLSITNIANSPAYNLGANYSNKYSCGPRPGNDTDVAFTIGHNDSLFGRLAIRIYRYDSSSNSFIIKCDFSVNTRNPNYFNTVDAWGYWTPDGNYYLGQTTNTARIVIYRVDNSCNCTQMYNNTTYRRILNSGYYIQGTSIYTSSGTLIGSSVVNISSATNFQILNNLIFVRDSDSSTSLYEFNDTFNIVKIRNISTYNNVWSLEQRIAYFYCTSSGILSGYGNDNELEIMSLNRNSETFYKLYQANSTSDDLLIGKRAYNNDGLFQGTMPNNGALNYTPTASSQNIPAGYTSGGTITGLDNNSQILQAVNLTQNIINHV